MEISTFTNSEDLALGTALLEVLPRAMKTIRLRVRRECGDLLTVPQFRTLMQLRHGSSTNKSLADHIGVSVAAMSRIVGVLQDLGYVSRELEEQNRREVCIALNATGRAYVRQSLDLASRDLAQSLGYLSRGEKLDLMRGLDILLRTIC